MRSADRDAAVPWEIAIPAGSPIAGIDMAGFRGRGSGLADLRMIPHPAVTVFIDFGDAQVVDEGTGERIRGAGVIGLAPARLRGVAQDLDCLQIRVSPIVARALLGASSELSGSFVGLEELWGRDAGRLRERLHEQRSWAGRFEIAQAALARRFDRGYGVDPEVAYGWRRMLAAHGGMRVERVADDVGWSRKRFWSRFRSQIGLTPKRAAQLIRFDYAAHRLAAGQPTASVAADSGYADQSHLHRDTAAITGLTPSTVAGAAWLSVDDIAWASAYARGSG
jgi:AraC-like DNA-binding protein